jgi:hypothetical protein
MIVAAMRTRCTVTLDDEQIELIDRWRNQWPNVDERLTRASAIASMVDVFLDMYDQNTENDYLARIRQRLAYQRGEDAE